MKSHDELKVGDIITHDGIQAECIDFIESEDGEVVVPTFRDLEQMGD